MIPEIDIWRTAWIMVKQRGDEAAIDAVMTAETMLAAGDSAGAAIWYRILDAIEQLECAEPSDTGENVH